MPNSKDTIGYNELDELLRENVEHILICTSYAQAKYDVKNMGFDDYVNGIYGLLDHLEKRID